MIFDDPNEKFNALPFKSWCTVETKFFRISAILQNIQRKNKT